MTALELVAVVLLIAANAFIVASEYALVTAPRGELAERAAAGRRGARTALRLMEEPGRFVATIQVANAALTIAIGALGILVLRDLLEPAMAAGASIVLGLVLITYFGVVAGELIPKTVGVARAARVAALVAPVIDVLQRVLWPLVWLLQRSAQLVLRPLGFPAVPAASVHTVEELRAMLADAEDSGVLDEAEEEMLYRVFDFADAEVGDVMVPWSDVTALPLELSAAEALERIVDAPHTRYPVYREDIDHIVGVLHVRDLFVALHEAGEEHVRLESLLRPVDFVPETKDLGALLQEMRRSSHHLAIVMNEYGATIGLATLEDLIEEIIGEIEDEFDLPDESVTRLDDGRIRVFGSFTVDDFNEQFHTSLPQEHFRTLGGLVFGELGRQPRIGDTVTLERVELTVDSVEGPRAETLVVKLPPAG